MMTATQTFLYYYYYYYHYYYFLALVLHSQVPASQGLKISKSKNVCLERL